MKINQPPVAARTPAAADARLASVNDRQRSPGASGVTPSTQVTLSAGADLKAAGDDGGFDAAKVESLKAAIDAGTFKVNAQVVADKLIASNVEALSSAPRV